MGKGLHKISMLLIKSKLEKNLQELDEEYQQLDEIRQLKKNDHEDLFGRKIVKMQA